MEVCLCGAENTGSLTWDAERGHISDHQKNRSVTHKGCNTHHVPPGPGDWQGRDQHTQQELGSTDRTGLELHLVYKQVGEDIDDALKLCVCVWGGDLACRTEAGWWEKAVQLFSYHHLPQKHPLMPPALAPPVLPAPASTKTISASLFSPSHHSSHLPYIPLCQPCLTLSPPAGSGGHMMLY